MSKLLSPKVLIPVAIVVVAIIVQNLLSIPGVILPKISIPAEEVFTLFGFPITNTLVSAWFTMLLLIVVSWLITRKLKIVPGRLQSLLEMLIEGFHNLVEGTAGSKWTPKFFPIVMTIFLFVITSSWLGLTPLFGSWGALHHAEPGEGHPVEWVGEGHSLGILVKEGATAESGEAVGEEEMAERYIIAPMFRAATTDMNFTVALALISVALTQYFGVQALGVRYFGKFVGIGRLIEAFTKPRLGCVGRIGTFLMGALDVFIGIVETISEVGKIISFSFRLFGNIFAGEVLLGVMAFLIPYIISLPFFGLELFVGVVQALVFMMLTVAFFVVAVTSHGEGH